MNRATWVLALAIAAGTLTTSAASYPRLPDRVPTHWNWKGEIDGYGPKATALFLMPGMLVVMIAVFAALPYLSPPQFQIDNFRATYQYIVIVIVGLFAYIHGVLLWGTGRPGAFDMSRVLMSGMFLSFALLGNVLGKVRRNFYVGIRVPWTLASDRVWNETHRLGACMLVGASLVGVVLTLAGYLIVALAILGVAVVVPIAYSFWLSKKLEREGVAAVEARGED